MTARHSINPSLVVSAIYLYFSHVFFVLLRGSLLYSPLYYSSSSFSNSLSFYLLFSYLIDLLFRYSNLLCITLLRPSPTHASILSFYLLFSYLIDLLFRYSNLLPSTLLLRHSSVDHGWSVGTSLPRLRFSSRHRSNRPPDVLAPAGLLSSLSSLSIHLSFHCRHHQTFRPPFPRTALGCLSAFNERKNTVSSTLRYRALICSILLFPIASFSAMFFSALVLLRYFLL